MLKVFDLENINFDELLVTALDDPQAIGETKAFRGIDFADLQTAYRQFCKKQAVPRPAVDLAEVIAVYNKAASDLPDHTRLKGLKLPGASVVLDRKGNRFAEVFEENQRRVWVVLADIPDHVQNAFVAAEDKRFHQHKGIDEHGLIRAFIGNLAQSGRPQGGSTITQQVVKNLLVGDDLTYERKIREMIVAARVEIRPHRRARFWSFISIRSISAAAPGESSWRPRATSASRPSELTIEESALLAGLTKGPNFYNPDRHPVRARERLAYVLSRMREDGKVEGIPDAGRNLPQLPTMIAHERPRRDVGFHFVDQVAREAKALAGLATITADSYSVRSTLDPQLQRTVEETLQEGLWRYERNTGRLQFRRRRSQPRPGYSTDRGGQIPETRSVRPGSRRSRMRDSRSTTCTGRPPSWWKSPAPRRMKRGASVSPTDGSCRSPSITQPPAANSRCTTSSIVRVTETKGKAARAELRIRPAVQGAVVVLENKTGRILAMSGGFSYPLSQLNRSTQATRQPGSAIKPLQLPCGAG